MASLGYVRAVHGLAPGPQRRRSSARCSSRFDYAEGAVGTLVLLVGGAVDRARACGSRKIYGRAGHDHVRVQRPVGALARHADAGSIFPGLRDLGRLPRDVGRLRARAGRPRAANDARPCAQGSRVLEARPEHGLRYPARSITEPRCSPSLIGALAGLHTSTWGMYKDAPHEGFTWPKYFRSTVVGAALGARRLRLRAAGISSATPARASCTGA